MLQSVAIFDDGFETMLPDDFADMPPELAQRIFPSEKRPQVIKGTPDGSLFATFSLVERSLSREQLFAASYNSLALLQKFYPSCFNQRVNIIPLENSLCAWFSFPARGNMNILFIIAIDGKMVLGSCGCPEDDLERMDEVKMAFLSFKTALKGKEAD